MKITFIGGGNMAVALIGGLKKKGFSAAGIQVVEPGAEARERLTDSFGVRCAPAVDTAALNCEAIVLAVKPQQMREAVAPLAGRLAGQLVISIAAGVRIADMSRWLGGHANLVRTMPNTPALIGSGVTGLCAAPGVDADGRVTAEKILGAVGRTVWIDDEARMDAVTAVSGSGPGYVFYLMEALADAATELGFAPEVARLLAVETFLGAARLAEASPEPLSLLRERVTSKGGTTAAALQSFDEAGLRAIIARGVRAATARGRELGDLMGKD
ncbi:MAG: pyrroline-5-carboxylate reductase [Rhodocyclaceae bacterium]|jgi:pyrroline-5-carboxylate reductase|nr:pyrroline-5-carboxylate reductase [Rhodocyclaceae bacterium]MBK6554932.1 pyrroline-5-carboxylate reductase [Rhodocyclaceae bacterium]MBK6677116.1 pyrroline-5-carboxylate reductase [Rhodocyclaceae bacterium]MBK9309787.1 pyrroline-5-carboxylate reductase [Rhodocyclaceae bacterium]MBK9955125.1 pyrroline-5-carboxylate reductase [Rhodocyclaceae bacterium]